MLVVRRRQKPFFAGAFLGGQCQSVNSSKSVSAETEDWGNDMAFWAANDTWCGSFILISKVVWYHQPSLFACQCLPCLEAQLPTHFVCFRLFADVDPSLRWWLRFRPPAHETSISLEQRFGCLLEDPDLLGELGHVNIQVHMLLTQMKTPSLVALHRWITPWDAGTVW